MQSPAARKAQSARQTVALYVTLAMLAAVVLGYLHLLCADFTAGGVHWFDLDRERNLPTWYSGALYVVLACVACGAYFVERRRNAEGEPCFRLPGLWLGVAGVALAVSLDDTTILHENLLWLKVRQLSDSVGGAWIHVTQWQLLYAPIIALTLVSFALLFVNRFCATADARWLAFAALGCLVLSLGIEGIRGIFKLSGEEAYHLSALIEEELEMLAPIFLAAAIASYVADVSLNFTDGRRQAAQRAPRLLNARSLLAVGLVLALLATTAAAIFYFARKQDQLGAPTPELFRRMRERSSDKASRTHAGGSRPWA